MNLLHVVGARPNFMKVAPVLRALERRSTVTQALVHTGQHYDVNMSARFFKELEIPDPDVNLEVGSGTHAQQTAEIMSRLEPVIVEHKPDLVLVYGDVNSTIAGALVCAKLLIPVGHVEAGLRSFDRTMPEEINRLVSDQLSDLLFTPSEDNDENLQREGISSAKIHRVGNVMIDTLVRCLPLCSEPRLGELGGEYALVTLHRPSNVDDPNILSELIKALEEISRELVVLFPVHPRTRQIIRDIATNRTVGERLRMLEPLGYLEFLSLQRKARLVITDSGGVQEEATYLGVPCLTVRENTERPVTVAMGTNILVGRDTEKLREEVERIVAGQGKVGSVPPLWDGQAAERIAAVIESWLDQKL